MTSQRQALKQLQQMKDVLFKPAEKGGQHCGMAESHVQKGGIPPT